MTGLEALNKIQHDFGQLKGQELVNCYEVIYKSLKALEIIKEKPQAGLSLIQLGQIKTYEEYLHYTSEWELDLYGDMVYTEEEFELLRSVLEC